MKKVPSLNDVLPENEWVRLGVLAIIVAILYGILIFSGQLNLSFDGYDIDREDITNNKDMIIENWEICENITFCERRYEYMVDRGLYFWDFGRYSCTRNPVENLFSCTKDDEIIALKTIK